MASGGPPSLLGQSLSPRTAEPRRSTSTHTQSGRNGPGLGTPARTPAQALAARVVERDSVREEFMSILLPANPVAGGPVSSSEAAEFSSVLNPVPERALSIASTSELPRDKASRILGKLAK